jgi:hypothetical protein
MNLELLQKLNFIEHLISDDVFDTVVLLTCNPKYDVEFESPYDIDLTYNRKLRYAVLSLTDLQYADLQTEWNMFHASRKEKI